MNGSRPLVVSAVPRNAIPLRKAEGFKPAEAARSLYRAMRPLDMPGVVAAGLKKETIFWRLALNGWTTVRWVTVTQYARELLRLRNDLPPFIPTNVWPFALPEYRPFKLTLHWSEFNASLGEPVFAFCGAMADKAAVHGWHLFDGEQGYPGYAWTQLAHKWYAENKNQG
jgi:hypothetical protein